MNELPLRDRFALAALPALLAEAELREGKAIRPGDAEADGTLTVWQCIAEDAYDLADALLAEREYITVTPQDFAEA